jgi:hypothetical protein
MGDDSHNLVVFLLVRLSMSESNAFEVDKKDFQESLMFFSL